MSLMKVQIGISLIAFLSFAATVYSFPRYGADWVDRLDDQVGEVMARRAERAWKARQPEEAVQRYRAALRLTFENPNQRVFALERLAEIHLERGEPDQAIPYLEEALERQPGNLKRLYLLTAAYRQAKLWDAARSSAQRWADEAARQNVTSSQLDALYMLGSSHEAVGALEEALDAYRAAASVDPGTRSAYHAAVLLEKLGSLEEARDLLRSYLRKASGWRADAARKLADQIESRLPAATQ